MNDTLKNSIHDIYYNIYNIELNDDELRQIIKTIPRSILDIGAIYGHYDTEFCDEVFCWLKENKYERN